MKRILISFVTALLFVTATVAAQEPPPEPAPPPAPAKQAAQPAAQQDAPPKVTDDNGPKPDAAAKHIVVPAGTRLPLVLHNAITTRSNKPGDPLYLETTFPVVVGDRIVIPAGSYVSGEILDAKRPGKVKGRGELMVRLTTLILPNGYATKFDAIPTGVGTGANDTVEEEGKIKGDSDKSSDIGTIVNTTTLGTGVGGGVGAVTGRPGMGLGVGAAAGAAAGLLWTLFTRGPDLTLPRGASLDIMLDRPLYLDASKINFTEPGRASTMGGPPNREPQRPRIPF